MAAAGRAEARQWLDLASKVATIAGAWCLPPHGGDLARVMVARSSRDVKADRSRVSVTTLGYSRAARTWSPLGPFPIEIPDVKMISPSPSGRFMCVAHRCVRAPRTRLSARAAATTARHSAKNRPRLRTGRPSSSWSCGMLVTSRRALSYPTMRTGPSSRTAVYAARVCCGGACVPTTQTALHGRLVQQF